MSTEDHSTDVAAAWGRMMAAAGGRKTKGGTVKSRAEAEKPVVLPTDGRRKRATGRDMQLNIKVKPAFREELQTLADAREIGLAELLERIFSEWESSGAKGAANKFAKKGAPDA